MLTLQVEIENLSDKLAEGFMDKKKMKKLRWAVKFFMDFDTSRLLDEQILEVIAKGAIKAMDIKKKKKVGLKFEAGTVRWQNTQTVCNTYNWQTGEWEGRYGCGFGAGATESNQEAGVQQL